MHRAAACLLLALLPAPLLAQLSVGGRIGTTGAVVEAGLRLGSHLGVRASTAFGAWSYRQRMAQVSYEADIDFTSHSGIVDYYPSRNGSFHLSGGVMTPPAEVTATGNPSLNHYYAIGDHSYTEAQIGTLNAEVVWPDALPYVGLGWSGARYGERLGVVFDLGVAIGTPTATLSTSGGSGNASLAADLAAEELSIQNDIDSYLKVYPMVSIGVRLRL